MMNSPPVCDPLDGVPQGVAQRGRVDSVSEDTQGQAVGQPDELVGEEERERRGHERDRDARPDLLDRVARLDGLVAHQQDAAEQDEQPVGGDHDLPGAIPELADAGQVADRRRGQRGVADQLEDRIQRVVDDTAERRVDGLGDARADVGDAAVRVAVAAPGARLLRVRARRRRSRLRDAVLARARLARLRGRRSTRCSRAGRGSCTSWASAARSEEAAAGPPAAAEARPARPTRCPRGCRPGARRSGPAASPLAGAAVGWRPAGRRRGRGRASVDPPRQQPRAGCRTGGTGEPWAGC